MQLAENFIDMCLKQSMEFIDRESQRSVYYFTQRTITVLILKGIPGLQKFNIIQGYCGSWLLNTKLFKKKTIHNFS